MPTALKQHEIDDLRMQQVRHLEAFLRAKRKFPTAECWWPQFKRRPSWQKQLEGERLPFDVGTCIPLDHVSYYDAGDIRYMVNEPYRDIDDADLSAFARVNGFHGWFRLPPEFGTHFPPAFDSCDGGQTHCRIYVFWKRRR